MRKIIKILMVFAMGMLILGIFILFIRKISLKQLDDVSPEIDCENELIEKSETLMIIPFFENVSIAENKTWCNWILSLNKSLGMHGVYHSYREFLELREENYIFIGIEEFKKCFGVYPKIFEAPQVALSKENEKLLKKMSFEVRGSWFNIFHKVYHCSDAGKFSNKFMDLV
jgi:predicted deacetylase